MEKKRDLGGNGLNKTLKEYTEWMGMLSNGLKTQEEVFKRFGRPPYWFLGKTGLICPAAKVFKPDYTDEDRIEYQWLTSTEKGKELFAYNLRKIKGLARRAELLSTKLMQGKDISINGLEYTIDGFYYEGIERPATGLMYCSSKADFF
jgi:hypothetical protein